MRVYAVVEVDAWNRPFAVEVFSVREHADAYAKQCTYADVWDVTLNAKRPTDAPLVWSESTRRAMSLLSQIGDWEDGQGVSS